MTAEEVAEAYGEAILNALHLVATQVPATALLQMSLGLQESLESLTQSEPTARPAAQLVTSIARYARLANETMLEAQRQQLERIQKQYGPPEKSDPSETS